MELTGPSEIVLAIDLGTSNTVAVMRRPDGRTWPLLFDGQNLMPSAVFLDARGQLLAGWDSYRLAQSDPSRYEPNPKQRIDEQTVLLGGTAVETCDLLAAVLVHVAAAATKAAGSLPAAVLTHPATWGAPRRQVLIAAAQRAGWRTVQLVPEPVAAVRYFTGVQRHPVPPGGTCAVFDFGGGTLDVAVVRNDGHAFTVIGSGGIGDLGGIDIDAAIADHVGVLVARHSPQAWRRLQQPATELEWRNRWLFMNDVRGAKETLSRRAMAPVPVPGMESALHLTREELEDLAGPIVQRGVAKMSDVLRESGVKPGNLSGLFLVGGSSRMPLVARLLNAELGIHPIVLEQPEIPVAEGALAEATAQRWFHRQRGDAEPAAAEIGTVDVAPESDGMDYAGHWAGPGAEPADALAPQRSTGARRPVAEPGEPRASPSPESRSRRTGKLWETGLYIVAALTMIGALVGFAIDTWSGLNAVGKPLLVLAELAAAGCAYIVVVGWGRLAGERFDADSVNLVGGSIVGFVMFLLCAGWASFVWALGIGAAFILALAAARMHGRRLKSDRARAEQAALAAGEPLPLPVPQVCIRTEHADTGGRYSRGEGYVRTVAFSPDGRFLVTGGGDGTVRFWDPRSGRPIRREISHDKLVRKVAFSPGSRVLATLSDDTVRLWDPATGKPVGPPFTDKPGQINDVAFGPDGQLAISVTRELGMKVPSTGVKLYNPRTRQPVGRPMVPSGFTDNIAFSADGRFLAASCGADVWLWRPATGRPVGRPLTGHTSAVRATAFSPDGRILATGSSDLTVRLWDPTTGQPIGHPLTGHADVVCALAFSPDGRLLATGSHDNSVRLWDPTTCQSVGQPLTEHTDTVLALAFNPDGSLLATAGSDATLRLWSCVKFDVPSDPEEVAW